MSAGGANLGRQQTASAFSEEYFARCYGSYERKNPPRKLAFYRGLVELAAAGVERPRVLDIGCAFGSFLSVLPAGWRLHGQEVSEFALGRARRRLPEAELALVEGAEIPFAGPFDVVVTFDVAEHVPRLDVLRREVRSKLRQGGHWIVVVPVYDGPTGPLIRWLDRDPTHLHKRSRDFWLGWLGEVFQVVDWLGIYRYLLPWNYYLHWPTRWLRRWTPAIVIVARRAAEAGPSPTAEPS